MKAKKASLVTSAATVDFTLQETVEADDFREVEISLHPTAENVCFGTPCHAWLSPSDFTDLEFYFQNHVEKLLKDPSAESNFFIPTEVNFRFQALSGDVENKFDGYFSLRFSIRLKDHNGLGLYYGFEGTIDLHDLNFFLAQWRKLVK